MAIQIVPNFRKSHYGILQEPDKKLRIVSRKVNKINSMVIEVANKLTQVLKEIDRVFIPWLGMTAPQLGYNLRIIAIKNGYGKYQIMINPEFLDQRCFLPTISGCYSLRGLYILRSPYWVKIKYTDLENKTHTEVFYGGMAILLKQEINHLEGKLISD